MSKVSPCALASLVCLVSAGMLVVYVRAANPEFSFFFFFRTRNAEFGILFSLAMGLVFGVAGAIVGPRWPQRVQSLVAGLWNAVFLGFVPALLAGL